MESKMILVKQLLCYGAFLTTIICVHCATISTENQNPDKFLLVLFDGLRWDYLKDPNLVNFNRFRRSGVHAEYMQPGFPSLSYPGYYTILTGLHTENHGFIENTMYDPVYKMFFWTDSDVNGSQPFWWEGSEPVWTTSTKAGRRTSVYLWPGCHVSIKGVQPTYFEKYERFNDTLRFQKNMADVLEKFAKNETDVGIVYTEYTDLMGHMHGPESKTMKSALKTLDDALGKFLDDVENRSMTDKLNIIFVSDHGMTSTEPATTKRVKLTDAISLDDVEFLLGSGAEVGVHPIQGKLNKVFNELLKLNDCIYVWQKEDIPEEFYFKNHYRVPPIQVVARPGCLIDHIANSTKQIPPSMNETTPTVYNGFHGYIPNDTVDMRAIFLARGPAFKENMEAKYINMTDVYNLMVYLLKLKGHPNNGTWSSISGMLKEEVPVGLIGSNDASKSGFSSFRILLILMGISCFMYGVL